MTGLNSLINSENGVLNIILVFLFALGAVFGISEEPIQAAVMAVAPLVGVVREIIKGNIPARWVGNIITYLVAGLTLAVPALADLFNILGNFADALISGGLTAALPALFAIVNTIWVMIRDGRFKKKEEEPATA